MTVSSRFKDRFSFKSSSKPASRGTIWVQGLINVNLYLQFVSFKHIIVIIFTENISPQHPKYSIAGDCAVSGWFGGRCRRDGHHDPRSWHHDPPPGLALESDHSCSSCPVRNIAKALTPEAGATRLSSSVISCPKNWGFFKCVLLFQIVAANLKFVCDISLPKYKYLLKQKKINSSFLILDKDYDPGVEPDSWH